MNTNLDAGSNAYLITRAWMKKYAEWILFEEFRSEKPANQIRVTDDHFTANHPGPMLNEELLEVDKDGENVYGTGQVKGLESEYIDMYVD